VTTVLLWGGFILFVLALLALDQGVLNRDTAALPPRAALAMTALWVGVATAFGVGLFFWRGSEDGLGFFAGYLIEYALSLDNVFIFVLIFGAFGVPPGLQRRVLFWGVLGALVMRGLLIVVGLTLVERFDVLLALIGVFLVVSGIRLVRQREEVVRPMENRLTTLVRRLIPVSDGYGDERFFVRRGGRRVATPLFIVLLTIESTDLAFAFDSIPAVFGVTTDSFIVFSSNVFAVLGLRSLYFVLSEAVGRLYYLRAGLAAILVFIGIELAVSRWVEVPVAVSLLAVVFSIGLASLASAIRTRRLAARGHAETEPEARLCELPRTEFSAEEAFGCRRRLELTDPPGRSDPAQRSTDAPFAGTDVDAKESRPGRDQTVPARTFQPRS
jgi:tellurite resistance protein TerC